MPKTYKDLYERVCAFSNLYFAHRRARRGGKRRLPHVAEFEHNLGENLLALEEELWTRRYRPGPYRSFIVVERKERKISAAPYRDRVVHHALMRVIGPIFEARMIHDSYANRKGKGTHAALDRLAAPVPGAIGALEATGRPRGRGLEQRSRRTTVNLPACLLAYLPARSPRLGGDRRA